MAKPRIKLRNTNQNISQNDNSFEKGEAVITTGTSNKGLYVAIDDHTMEKVGHPMVSTTGTSTISVMSQKSITDALDTKFNKTDIKQDTGTSTDATMSQNAISTAINNAKTTVVQTTGTSTTSVMSQNGVTEAFKVLDEDTPYVHYMNPNTDVVQTNPNNTPTSYEDNTIDIVAVLKTLWRKGYFRRNKSRTGACLIANGWNTAKVLETPIGSVLIQNAIFETFGSLDYDNPEMTDEEGEDRIENGPCNISVRITIQNQRNYPTKSWPTITTRDNTIVYRRKLTTDGSSNGTVYDLSSWSVLGKGVIFDLEVPAQYDKETLTRYTITLKECVSADMYYVDIDETFKQVNELSFDANYGEKSTVFGYFGDVQNQTFYPGNIKTEFKFLINNTSGRTLTAVAPDAVINTEKSIESKLQKKYLIQNQSMALLHIYLIRNVKPKGSDETSAEIRVASTIEYLFEGQQTNEIGEFHDLRQTKIKYIEASSGLGLGTSPSAPTYMPKNPVKNTNYHFIIKNTSTSTAISVGDIPNNYKYGATLTLTIPPREVGEVNCLYVDDGQWLSRTAIVQ